MKESVVTWRPRKYAPKRGINRRDGECDQLLNTVPTRVTGSEYTRYGYKALTSITDPALPDPPTDVVPDYHRYASTESPSAKEVLFLFGHTGATKYDYCYSWVKAGASAFSDEWVLLNESSTGITVTVTGANTFTATTGVSAVADYHNLWIAKHATKGTVLITDYSWTPSTGTFTVLQDLTGVGSLGWSATESVDLYRWNHSNPTFVPNFDLPHVVTREGSFRVNGGKGTTAGNRGLWMGYINRTFFPGSSFGTPFTYQGTYVAERQLKSTDAPTTTFTYSNNAAGWGAGKTLWSAVGVIYDGYQHGPLAEDATGNYDATNARQIATSSILSPGTINKRITHVVLYVAEDDGNTTTQGRQNPFYEVLRSPIVGNDFANDWAEGATGSWERIAAIGSVAWENRGNTFEDNAGFTNGVDTMYSFDIETSMLNRQWAGRIYNYTESKEDLDRVYTNPRQNGIIAPDIFALEPDVFVGRVLWGDSSYITNMVSSERGRMVVIKDRAVVDMGVDENPDGSLLFRPNAISTNVGCASVNGCVNTPFGIFFAGYDDIWRFDGQLKPLTREDWEDVYRAISTANKQACIAWFRPEDNSITFQFNSTGSTFTYFLGTQDWRQTQYAHLMGSYSQKRDGSIVWVSSTGTTYLFDTTATDAGTAIAPKFKTGLMRCASVGVACIYRDGYFNKNAVETAGTLDVNLILSYEGSSTTKAFSTLTKSDKRLALPTGIDDACVFDLLSIEYNVNAGPATGPLEVGDIELYLFEEPKRVIA